MSGQQPNTLHAEEPQEGGAGVVADPPAYAPKVDSKTQILGVCVVIVLLSLLALLISQVEIFELPHYLLLFTGIALTSGILFWILTPGSSGQLNNERLGIKLGGGAGIGAAMMALSLWGYAEFVESDRNYVLFPLPDRIQEPFSINVEDRRLIAEIAQVKIDGDSYIYIEFQNEAITGGEAASFTISYVNDLLKIESQNVSASINDDISW